MIPYQKKKFKYREIQGHTFRDIVAGFAFSSRICIKTGKLCLWKRHVFVLANVVNINILYLNWEFNWVYKNILNRNNKARYLPKFLPSFFFLLLMSVFFDAFLTSYMEKRLYGEKIFGNRVLSIHLMRA